MNWGLQINRLKLKVWISELLFHEIKIPNRDWTAFVVGFSPDSWKLECTSNWKSICKFGQMKSATIAVISKKWSQYQKIKISIADSPLVHTWFSPRPIFGVKAVVIEEVWTVPRKTIQSIMIFSKVCEIFLHDKKRRGNLSSTSSCQFSPSSSCLLSYCLWMRAQKARPSFHELLMSETCTPG